MSKIENSKNKPKKTAVELVQMLRDEKGIQFNIMSEEQAVEYFSQRNNYLRTASYRKNYPKHIAGPNEGKYINLEFVYLTELSTLDFYLREILLEMCIDVEHDLKVSLLRELEADSDEDGYALVRDFLAKNPEILSSIERKTDASFTGELIEKYFGVCSVFSAQGTQSYLTTRIYSVDCPIWVLEELIGFGEFLRLYRFYAERNPQFKPLMNQRVLNPVKSLRNACAHNNCLLNVLSRTSTTKPSPEVSAFVASFENISAGERRSKLTSRPMFEIVCLLYAYTKIVSPSVKKRRIAQLSELIRGRLQKHMDYFDGPTGNKLVATSFDFLKKVVDNLI